MRPSKELYNQPARPSFKSHFPLFLAAFPVLYILYFSLLLLFLCKQIPELCPAPVPVHFCVPDPLPLFLLRPYRRICQARPYLLPARNEKILKLLFLVCCHFHFLLMLISFFCVSF